MTSEFGFPLQDITMPKPVKRKAPGEGKTRVQYDFYPTPDDQTQELIRVVGGSLKFFHGYGYVRALEPCVGQGHIVNSFTRSELPLLNWTTNDLDPRHPASFHDDATLADTAIWHNGFNTWDYVVTNPPFSAAAGILARSLGCTKVFVAMLLRLSFLEPVEERRELLDRYPPDKILVLPRYSYRRNGSTDSVTSAWFIWAIHHRFRPTGPAIEVVPMLGRSKQGGLEIG